MIKKLIGVIVATAVIIVVVLATLQRKEFRSMINFEQRTSAETKAQIKVETKVIETPSIGAPEVIQGADTTAHT